MFFDAATMARACSEIERGLLGAKLREPVQLRHDEVLLIFGRDLPEGDLLLSSSPEAGRVCLMPPEKPTGPPQAFGLALRRHLRGARLTAVEQLGFDRAVRLEFEECMGFGRECRRALVVEVMGKYGNMVLLDENGLIVSCAKHVPSRLNRYRQIMEGEPYVPPPQFGKLDPRDVTAEQLAERAESQPEADLHAFLRAHCLGTSKVFLAEVLARFGSAPEVGSRWESRLGDLVDLLCALTAESRAEGPVHVYQAPGRSDLPAQFAYPIRLRCCGPPVRDEPHLGAALSPLLAAETASRRTREARQRLVGAASAQLRNVDGRVAEWRARVRKAEAAEEDRWIGELLLAQPHAASPHADTVELIDYFTEGAPTITVRLDPPGNVHGTAERHFARYKRARRLLAKLPPLIEEGDRESRYLESVLAEIELAEGLEDLATIEEELVEQGYVRARQAGSRAQRRRRGAAPRLRAVTSGDGYPILYGTNHLQNEELVRQAAPDDLWLHVQGAPGAHVLVRTDGQPEKVPQSTLLEAARIAVRWSHLRNQGLVDVDCTLAKYVRKAKGERPGMVYYTRQRTVTVSL